MVRLRFIVNLLVIMILSNNMFGQETQMPLRILALGDSYTIGEGVAESERWPEQLAERLRTYSIPVGEVKIIARNGWRTDQLRDSVLANQPGNDWDWVLLLIGVNNQYRGLSPDAYHREFGELLQQAIAFAGGDPQRVLVLSIPDWSVTPFGSVGGNPGKIAGEIDTFNAINRSLAQSAGVRYVDITPISRQAPQDPDLIAADGLHPSGKMYAAWVALILKEQDIR